MSKKSRHVSPAYLTSPLGKFNNGMQGKALEKNRNKRYVARLFCLSFQSPRIDPPIQLRPVSVGIKIFTPLIIHVYNRGARSEYQSRSIPNARYVRTFVLNNVSKNLESCKQRTPVMTNDADVGSMINRVVFLSGRRVSVTGAGQVHYGLVIDV